MLIKAIFQTELLLLSFFMFSQVGGVEADLLFLSTVFAINICAYAVMSNQQNSGSNLQQL